MELVAHELVSPGRPWGPQLQHPREKRESNQPVVGKTMAKVGLSLWPLCALTGTPVQTFPGSRVTPAQTHAVSHSKPSTAEKERSHWQTATGQLGHPST